MAILKVARLGHPILRRVADTVPREEIGSTEIQTLIDDMFETMDEYSGVGLAAPQVHRSLQIVVVDGIPDPDREGEFMVQRGAVVNPELTFLTDEEVTFFEGCLSVPDLRGRVPRVRHLRLKGFDRDGRPIDRELEDFAAVVYQHEVDHLNGIVFLDRMRDLSTLGYIPELERFLPVESVP
ncbi:MAG TPA: peptide deformylase [Acidobacteriota bacterium]|nr:peptide deformylase [Acidobacteriota bacterium]